MDYSRLPYIVALGLLIFTYWPLVRRSGSHVSLWFLGWTFILLDNVFRLLGSPPHQAWGPWQLMLNSLFIQCAGLAFMQAASNRQRWVIEPGMVAALAAGPVTQALLFLLDRSLALRLLPTIAVLYCVPLGCALAPLLAPERRGRRRFIDPLLAVSSAFALFGLSLLFTHHSLWAFRAVSLTMIFASAAYLLLRTSAHLDRGHVATSLGLAAWGVRYPALILLHRMAPHASPNLGALHIPEFVALLGSILLMMEERLNKVERLATHDPLTNLPNRRFLYERFAAALERARASRTTIGCLVIDVDNFKMINDTRGHAAGDELLRALAIRLGWHISARDVLARTGGDEFTVMLAGVSNEHYLRFVAEAMMSAACVPVQIEGEPVEVRISMGIAFSPDDADEIDDLIRLADSAMYRAKRRGGNVLVFAGEPEPIETTPRRVAAAQILQMAHPSRTNMAVRTAASSDR